ncbi:PglL family O-oligosaccharyltransferase, partial [Acinetobacter junii]|uniref:PglL family O-oligosaccharyltransferase n=1 Tax=Acinetobacter junii TaxID=40215 RepID=UPI00148F3636
LWRVALTALNNSTFWGFGWGQSSVAQMTISHIFPNPSREIMGYTHNLFLEILIWNGIWIGSLIIIVIVICFFKLVCRARSLDSIIGLMFIGVVLIHAMLEYPLAYAYYLLPVGFILGLIYGELIPVNNFITLSNKFSAMFISFGVILMILVWVDYRKVEVDHRLLRFELLRVGTLKAEQKSPDVFILTQLSEYIWAARTKPVAGMSDEDIERIRKVAYRYPDGFLVYKYIMVLYLNDRHALINNEIIKFNGLYNQNINIDDLIQEKIIIPRY